MHRVIAGGLERAPGDIELLDVEGLRQGRGRQQQGADDADAGGHHAFACAPHHCAVRSPHSSGLSALPAAGNGARAPVTIASFA